MNGLNEILFDESIRCGGFYELAIQVCPSINNEPIKLYTDYIWSLKTVTGPFDENFNKIDIDIENFQHNGLIKLDNYEIPFMTYNIRETEPIETGFNWFDICFYTAAIQKVFGSEYNTWDENPRVPEHLTSFLNRTLKDLYKIFPFELAMLDFEISGQYYFEDLTKPLVGSWMSTNYYVGQKNIDLIIKGNKKYVKQVEELS